MKATLALILSVVYSAAFSQARIEFQYNTSEAGQTKTYNVPLPDGRLLYLNLQTAKVDSRGKAILQLNLKKPGIVNLGTPIDPIEIYVEPKASMVVDLRDSVTFSGSLAKENTMIRKLKRNGLPMAAHAAQRPKAMQAMEQLKTPAELLKRLDSLVKAGDKLVDDLLEEDNISMSFIDYMRADNRMYYYDMAFLSVYYQHFGQYVYNPVATDTSLLESEWGVTLTKLAEEMEANVNSNYYESSLAYFNCIYDIVYRYQACFLKENSVIAEKDNMSRHTTDLFVSAVPYAMTYHLDERVREFFVPNFLAFYITGNQLYYTQDMLELYNTYKKDFPKSTYIAAMAPKIAEVEAAVKPVSIRNAGVQVIRNFTAINTFNDLVAPYRGKVVVIDVWAMWCGPCIQAFESLGPLKDLQAREKDLVVLYISRDHIGDRERWERFIMKRNLTGQHIIPNEALQVDIRARLNWDAIPRYALLNRNGEFINNDAPSPGSKEATELITKALAENK